MLCFAYGCELPLQELLPGGVRYDPPRTFGSVYYAPTAHAVGGTDPAAIAAGATRHMSSKFKKTNNATTRHHHHHKGRAAGTPSSSGARR